MSNTQQAPLPGWYDDGAQDGLLRWWNGRAWEDRYEPKPAPIIPVKQYPKWVYPVGVLATLAAIYAVYVLTPLHTWF